MEKYSKFVDMALNTDPNNLDYSTAHPYLCAVANRLFNWRDRAAKRRAYIACHYIITAGIYWHRASIRVPTYGDFSAATARLLGRRLDVRYLEKLK